MAHAVASAAAQAEAELLRNYRPSEAAAAANTGHEATKLANQHTDDTKTADNVVKLATAIVPLMFVVGGAAPYAMPVFALLGAVGGLFMSLFHKPEYETMNRPPPLTFAMIQDK